MLGRYCTCDMLIYATNVDTEGIANNMGFM